ncbi:hypothetical protein V6K52_05245 [Knoellia sp. S7-12]|uniref:hypothetical protein n=1 Tax=Knoellia sp. S7-12 TaxID=3126698 RepID=UPI003368166A
MTVITRSFGAALAALAITATLGACGSEKAGTSTESSSSSKPAAEAPKTKVGDEVDLSAVFTETAAAMKAKKSYAFTGETPEGAMSGQMRVDGDTTAMKIEATMEGEKATILFVDGAMYMGGMPDLPAGKTFIKIDPNADDPMSKMMAPFLSQMAESADPTTGLANIKGLKAKVVEVKDGTTTYEATLTAQQQLEMAKKSLEDMGMGDEPMPTPSAAMKPITVRQTIGADNLPTKIELSGSAESTMTLTYSGWGAPVDVVAPPADKVASFSDMM